MPDKNVVCDKKKLFKTPKKCLFSTVLCFDKYLILSENYLNSAGSLTMLIAPPLCNIHLDSVKYGNNHGR